MGAASTGFILDKLDFNKVVALVGNPNVGKSTIFNGLTGLNQHTGNWPGKTVTNAQGSCQYKGQNYILVDLPGSYSLMAHSAEEEVTRDFICFKKPDAVVVVCDATCLERNLNLVLQIMEITDNIIVCVNLIDEAEKKGISIDAASLSNMLNVPVVVSSARGKIGLDILKEEIFELKYNRALHKTIYPKYIEDAIESIIPFIDNIEGVSQRWLALKLLEGDKAFIRLIAEQFNIDLEKNMGLANELKGVKNSWDEAGITNEMVNDDIVSSIVKTAEGIGHKAITYQNKAYADKDRKIDKVLTDKWLGFPVMLIMMLIIFWITISGANYPSQLLSNLFSYLEKHLLNLFSFAQAPRFISEMLIFGLYRTVAWVVSVMLPPMAIFFPLFTILEDSGYLPRVAFNLDRVYKKCSACGKQALTMCMGFGCNAVGVTGCRIIDSPRERLIAIITNNFVPCNGRFPALIAIISMFFVGQASAFFGGMLSAIILTSIIFLGVIMTFIVSKLLSITLLKGVPSSFTLELPPYRKPQFIKVIVRSILDRALFVLGRSIAVAAPAGIIIWLMANTSLNGVTILNHCSNFLDPFARLFGMDGVILLAFILGSPANEIVTPIIIMAYMAQGSLAQLGSLSEIKALLVDNGWTWATAINVMIFSLMHWPCSTACITIKKETGSFGWMAVSIIIPTFIGLFICFAFTSVLGIVS
ncbi:MAG: ferrous iron transport protein B [Clostridiales bacterium]|jgi:ferrous iron transport protein B|nr:ferrous iron transport protein B [Clostridiales bacterium]